MATIADTLNDIQKLQNEVFSYCKNHEELENCAFVRDLMNFTTIHFFQLLAHTTLDSVRDNIRPLRHPYAEKYYSLYEQDSILEEFIRFDNISGMFILWNLFERYVDTKRAALPKDEESALEVRYKAILRYIAVNQPTYNAMINEFNLIRLTRNSLHNGGIYRYKKPRHFVLKGKKYELNCGIEVTPLRLMDIAETIWKHFVIIEKG